MIVAISESGCVHAMGSVKKVVIRRFTGMPAWGYLPQTGLVLEDKVVLLAVDGRINPIFLSEIKTIAVQNFNLDDPVDPERMGRRSFPARPRGDGLWLKLTFWDSDSLEGLAAVNLTLLDTLIADRGLFMTPPDGRGNTQRLFVPRAALRSLEVLGYVTAPSKRTAKDPANNAQPNLFGEPVE
jgi:hypothetical protein